MNNVMRVRIVFKNGQMVYSLRINELKDVEVYVSNLGYTMDIVRQIQFIGN